MRRNTCLLLLILITALAFVSGCGAKKSGVTPFTIPADMKGSVKADLNGDGAEEEIGFEKIADEYISQELILTIDGTEFDLKDGIYFFPNDDLKCFCIAKNGADKTRYIYMQQTAENDYQSVSIFRYTGSEMEYVDGFDGAVDFRKYSDADHYEEITLTDPEDFEICCVEQLMGTLSTVERCRAGDDGRPVQIGEYKYYTTGWNWDITAKTAIPAAYLKNDKSEDETPAELAEGWKVTPFRTDGRSFIDLKADGQDGIYRIYYSDDDGPFVIIDKSGNREPMGFTDAFDGLFFAG